jgi:endonuclease/exonuclease/phosphatase (EEP) superfamily protein YafD
MGAKHVPKDVDVSFEWTFILFVFSWILWFFLDSDMYRRHTLMVRTRLWQPLHTCVKPKCMKCLMASGAWSRECSNLPPRLLTLRVTCNYCNGFFVFIQNKML